MYALDLAIFYGLHGLSGQNAWLDGLIVFLGEYLLYVLLVILAYVIFKEFLAGRMEKVYGYCVATLGALVARFAVEPIIHIFYQRERPFLALHVSHLLTDTTYSFPSGHTIFLFALATGVYFVNRPFGYFLYAAGLAVGSARVAAGVHYPSDIMGGIVLGVLTGFLFSMACRKAARTLSLFNEGAEGGIE